MIVLEHARQGRRHERLAQPDHVADDDATALVEVMRGDLHGGHLEVEEFAAKVLWDAKFRQPGSRFPREMVRDLDVDMVRRDRLFSRPTLVDNLGECIGYIHAPAVMPAVFKPLGEFFAGVPVEHVNIEFALPRQSGEREVAASEVAHYRIDRIRTEQQVELGVKRVFEEQFDDDFFCLDLRCQPPQARLVLIGRRAQDQLFPKFLREFFLQAKCRLVVEREAVARQTRGQPKFVVRQALHPDEKPTTMPRASAPFFCVLIDGPPSAQIEIAHAKIRPIRDFHRLCQRGVEVLFNIVENSGHTCSEV